MDFERAEYVEPVVIDGSTGYVPGSARANLAAFPLALLYGVLGAIVGAVGYALIGLTGIMVSIVTIGIGWLVARAMMTATGGFGGRQYQVAAVVLTYLAASCGSLVDILMRASRQGVPLSRISPLFLLRSTFFGPFLSFGSSPLWAAMGLLILFYGLRTAWQMAAGSPGFSFGGMNRR